MGEVGFEGDSKYNVKYIDLEKVKHCDDSVKALTRFDSKEDDIKDIRLANSEQIEDFGRKREISFMTTKMETRKTQSWIERNKKCSINKCSIAMILALFITLFVTISVFRLKIKKLQAEQEIIKGQQILYKSLMLKSVGNEQAKNRKSSLEDMQKNWTDIAVKVDNIIDGVANLKNETDKQSEMLNKGFSKLTKQVNTNMTLYAKDIRDDLTEIGTQVADIEDDVNTLMNKTGVISTSLKERQFTFSSLKQIKFAILFETISFSSLWCMSDCLKNDHCASFAYDSVSERCIGFSNNCSSSTYLSDSSVYYKKKVQDRCDDGWEYLCGSCYFFSKFVTDWHSASRNCHAMSAHLAIITSANENRYLVSLGKRKYISKSDGFWLDGTDEQEEGKWIWNSTRKPLTYTSWYPGEPNNRGAEHCLEINKHIRSLWNDSPCAKEASQFICEKEVNSI